MYSSIKKRFLILIALQTCTGISYAAEMFGNPTDIGAPGQIELLVGGGKTTGLSLTAEQSTASLHIGSASKTYSLPTSAGKFDDEQVFFGLSYAVNAKAQLFANFGSGKSSDHKTNSSTFGLKLSPQTEGSGARIGIMLRAQQVTMDMQGPFTISSPYNTIDNGTTTSYFLVPINGSEQIKYNRLDAFIGAGTNTGTFRPYAGFCLTRISGTDKISLNDTVNVWSYPNAGGAGTSSLQQVSFNAQSDVSNDGNLTGVLGFGIYPTNEIGIVAEFQLGLQRSVSMSGNYRF